MDERVSRLLVIAKKFRETVVRLWSTGTALKNAAWVVGALALVWWFLGAPSFARMTQVWQIVEAMNSTPATLTQIAEPGAVVALTDMPYVASRLTKRGKLQQYGGTFHAGQRLCASLVTWGNSATLNVELPNHYLAEASNAPGNFRPDTSAEGCNRIPNVVRIPDPNGRQEVAAKQFAELMSANSGAVTTKAATAFYAVFLLFAFWMRAQNYRPRKAVPPDVLREHFKGFGVRVGDLEHANKKLYRVNSDGFRHNLKKWHFDENSGEYFLITNKIGGNVIFKTTPYGERFVKHAKTVWKKAGIGIVAAIAAFISVALWGMAASIHGGVGMVCFTLACAGALTIFAVLKFFLLITNWHLKIIGPEPLVHAIPEFGHQQPHGAEADDEGTI